MARRICQIFEPRQLHFLPKGLLSVRARILLLLAWSGIMPMIELRQLTWKFYQQLQGHAPAHGHAYALKRCVWRIRCTRIAAQMLHLLFEVPIHHFPSTEREIPARPRICYPKFWGNNLLPNFKVSKNWANKILPQIMLAMLVIKLGRYIFSLFISKEKISQELDSSLKRFCKWFKY